MKKGISIKNSFSLNILRLGLALIVIGLFLPISCDSNGYQISQGILGNADQAGKANFLANVDNIYGFIMFGVFLLAILGLIITFFNEGRNNFYYGFFCLAVSFVFLLIISNKFRIRFNSKEMAFFINVGIPIKVKLLAGWYSMMTGYILGTAGFILKIIKVID